MGGVAEQRAEISQAIDARRTGRRRSCAHVAATARLRRRRCQSRTPHEASQSHLAGPAYDDAMHGAVNGNLVGPHVDHTYRGFGSYLRL